MLKRNVSPDVYQKILKAADRGTYTTTAVSLLSRMLDHVDAVSPRDGFAYIVVENAYDVTVLRVYDNGVVEHIELED